MNRKSISVEGVHVEIRDSKEGFHFRLVDETSGKSTNWTGYASIAGISVNGKWFYAATGYYTWSDPSRELVPISGDELLSCIIAK